MSSIFYCAIGFIIGLGVFVFYVWNAYGRESCNDVTCREIRKIEYKLRTKYKKYLTDFRLVSQDGKSDVIDIDLLANKLKLKIKEIEPSENLCGSLNKTDDLKYNGVIRYLKTDVIYLKNFEIMHEIVHYIMDVGVGKRVTVLYAKTRRGDPKSHREQIVDYYAAALAIPKENLEKRLLKHLDEPYNEEFIRELMDIYKMPQETVERRITEVLYLAKYC